MTQIRAVIALSAAVVLSAIVAATCGACSSESTDAAGGGGAAGTPSIPNSAAGSGQGGNGASLPGQAAVTLGVQGPMQVVSQTSCPVAGKIYQVGATKKVGTVTTVQAPSDITPGVSVIDGEGGTVVRCSVQEQSDGSYAFSGSLHAASGENDPITVTITNGTIAADQVMGAGAVSVFTPQLAGTFDSGSVPCTFKVINKQVKGGSIWADFSCPTIAEPPSALCSIASSTIVFENCSGS